MRVHCFTCALCHVSVFHDACGDFDCRKSPHGGGFPKPAFAKFWVGGIRVRSPDDDPKPVQTGWEYSYSADPNSANSGFGNLSPWGDFLRSTCSMP